MALKRIVPPVVEPITLKEAKLHVRVDNNDEDNLISSQIKAAREYCEDYQKRSYIQQTWELTLDRFPNGEIEIPRPPFVSVESFKYFGRDNAEYTIDPVNYFVDTDSEPGRIIFINSIQPIVEIRPVNAIKIRYIAGEDPQKIANLSAKIKQAMLLLVGHWYENRVPVGTVSKEIEFAVSSLLGFDRMVSMV